MTNEIEINAGEVTLGIIVGFGGIFISLCLVLAGLADVFGTPEQVDLFLSLVYSWVAVIFLLLIFWFVRFIVYDWIKQRIKLKTKNVNTRT